MKTNTYMTLVDGKLTKRTLSPNWYMRITDSSLNTHASRDCYDVCK